jgi:hypothetical protein
VTIFRDWEMISEKLSREGFNVGWVRLTDEQGRVFRHHSPASRHNRARSRSLYREAIGGSVQPSGHDGNVPVAAQSRARVLQHP